MKLNLAVAFAATFFMVGIAEAQVPTVTRTGPNGQTLVLKLDGKYSTCLRDSQRLGYSLESATRYCDSKPGLKK
ncbi:hypothetical protein IVA95_15445 [Bradyrhizobium sp. 157]|uniref:hypothetical protein n=1 Tax=Bradyrhizobium sp. 157 TaxID=2782631 RepID=UPI001FF754F0|nr:hypothetical protein [Bradyrhizobium sp. 157]MCK1638957.1 hypothetical protein [Bradyrhizobium sp. 157]